MSDEVDDDFTMLVVRVEFPVRGDMLWEDMVEMIGTFLQQNAREEDPALNGRRVDSLDDKALAASNGPDGPILPVTVEFAPLDTSDKVPVFAEIIHQFKEEKGIVR